MKIIAITSPIAVDEEAVVIRRLLANGIDIVHLRKPEVGIDYCRELLEQLTSLERKRIVVHDYFVLYEEYGLQGAHLNRNITHYPTHYDGSRSCSCHSFDELVRYKEECDYLFLSPIFDSISKVGYSSQFSDEELRRAANEGIIDSRVIALGGVTFDMIPYLRTLNFGGVAMLGALLNIDTLLNEGEDFLSSRTLF